MMQAFLKNMVKMAVNVYGILGWSGFNRWKEPIIKRDPQELAESVREALALGSINLYMFHGGTNFWVYEWFAPHEEPLIYHKSLPMIMMRHLMNKGTQPKKYFALQKNASRRVPCVTTS